MTSSRKLLSTFVSVSLAALALGCNNPGEQQTAGPKPTAEAVRIAEVIRLRTDDLLLDLASGDFSKVRRHFAPGVPVDAREEFRRLLQVPPKTPFQVTQWNTSVNVAISPDYLRAQILPVVQVRVGATQPIYQEVGLTWVSSDKTWQTFYLEPLK